MRVHTEHNALGIPAYAMQDGQVAVLLTPVHFAGKVVQRYKDIIVVLGENCGNSFSKVIEEKNQNFRVRVLQKGTLLEV